MHHNAAEHTQASGHREDEKMNCDELFTQMTPGFTLILLQQHIDLIYYTCP